MIGQDQCCAEPATLTTNIAVIRVRKRYSPRLDF